MARIEATRHRPSLKARLIVWLTRRKLGQVPAGMRIRAGLPGLLEATTAMDRYFAAPRELPPRVFRLAMLKTAAIVGCPF
ncbi:MAG: hypothetical protein ACRD2E_11880 [Terriglobales bacterium]